MAKPATKLAEMPSSRRERLFRIIAERSFSKEGDFQLASGKSSTFYFDMKQTMLDPEGLDLIADLILEKAENLPANYVGGLAMGAVPIVVATLLKSKDTPRPLHGFWVRKEAKEHGTKRRADGYLPDGADVLMVDDVTTSGGSVIQAIEEVRSRRCKVAAVITVVDREEGARRNLAAMGIDLIALFSASDFAAP